MKKIIFLYLFALSQVVTLKAQTVPASNNPTCQVGLLHVNDDFKTVLPYAQTTNDYILNTSVYLPSANTFAQKGIFWTKDNFKSPNSDAVFSRNTSGVMPCTINQKLGEYGAFGVNFGQYFDSKNGLFRYYSLDLSKNAKVKLTLKNNGGSTINVRLFLTDSTFSETRALNADPSIKTANYTLGDEYYFYKVIAPGASATFDIDFSTALNIFYTGGNPLFEVNNGLNFNFSKVCGLGIIVRNNTFNASYLPLALNNYPIEISNFSIGDVTEKCPNTITGLEDINFNLNTSQKKITLKAVSSAGLPITYTVNDTAIAAVKGDILTIKKIGQTYIQATSGSGSTNFVNASKSADLYVASITVNPTKAGQWIQNDNYSTYPQKYIISGSNLTASQFICSHYGKYKMAFDSLFTTEGTNLTYPTGFGSFAIWVKLDTYPSILNLSNNPIDSIIISAGTIGSSILIPSYSILNPSIYTAQNLDNFTTDAGTPSAAQSFKIDADDLVDTLKVSIDAPFKMTTDTTKAFQSELYLLPNKDNSIVDQKVWIRIQSNLIETLNDRQITISSKYATKKVIIIPPSYVLDTIKPSLKVYINGEETTTFNAFIDTLGKAPHPQKLRIIGENLTNTANLSLFSPYQFDNNYSSFELTPKNGKIDTLFNVIINHSNYTNVKTKPDTVSAKKELLLYSNDFNSINLSIPESYIYPKLLPSITVSSDTLSPFTTNSTDYSKVQSFTLTIKNISSGNIVIKPSPSNNYSVSVTSDASDFNSANITLTGIKKDTTITVWVRAKANSDKIIDLGNISNSINQLSINVYIPKGTVTPDITTPPDPSLSLEAYEGIFDKFITTEGTTSAMQVFSVKGENIIGNATLKCPENFEFKKTESTTWTDSLVLSPTDSVINQEFEIRIKAKLDKYVASGEDSIVLTYNGKEDIDKKYALKFSFSIKPITLNPPVIPATGDSVSITTGTNINVNKVEIFYRKIRDPKFDSIALSATNGKYSFNINAQPLDELGLEYYFKINYDAGKSDTTSHIYNYQKKTNYKASKPIKKGNTTAAYQIVSFPFDVNLSTANTLLDSLKTYNKKKQRLFMYSYVGYSEYNTGFSLLENGRGYMYISKNGGDTLKYDNKNSIEANQNKPFEMELITGWNLIGNPYPFDVLWSDVLEANPTLGNTKLHILNDTGFVFGDTLKPFAGGFINNENSILSIKIPLVASNSNKRVAAVSSIQKRRTNINSELDWDINFVIEQNNIRNNFVGIGMNPDADSAYDQFDDEAMPRFVDYVDLYTTCKVNNKHKHLSKDVVKSTENHAWNYEFETNNTTEPVTIKWQQPSALSNDVYLVDQSAQKIISLKSTHSYSFTPTGEKQLFRLVYGNESYLNQALDFSHSSIINIAPNPSADNINVQFYATQTDADAQSSSIKVKNITGNTVSSFNISAFEGINTQKINIGHLPSGIYILELNIGNQAFNQKIIKQ